MLVFRLKTKQLLIGFSRELSIENYFGQKWKEFPTFHARLMTWNTITCNGDWQNQTLDHQYILPVAKKVSSYLPRTNPTRYEFFWMNLWGVLYLFEQYFCVIEVNILVAFFIMCMANWWVNHNQVLYHNHCKSRYF